MAAKHSITKKLVKQQAKQAAFSLEVKTLSKKQNKSISLLSSELGFNRLHLYRLLKNDDQYISLIVALSRQLETNLLENYIRLLPAHLQPTQAELALNQQITNLEKQLADITKERDWLKEVVGRR